MKEGDIIVQMKVLFVCKSNVGRSQMAEAFFLSLAPEHEATSAGTHVSAEGVPISETADKVVKTMSSAGIDVSHNMSNQLTPEMVETADKVVVLNAPEELPDYLRNSPKLEIWDVSNAAGEGDAFYDHVRDLIREKISDLVSRI